MLQGTSSWSGKSLIATALCRHFADRGVKVAPFKAQNMSNNARVVDGGEIGVAQYLQALAARITPDVRMNPVLVKPESSTSSQVVLRGQADREISAVPWRQRAPRLWQAALDSLQSLQREYELVILEGAGSPAEINLAGSDIANMRSAAAADAAVILVADIDRGGAFAHLYGTWALQAEPDRRRLAGFVLNKFRGDESLLAPAPQRLRELTGMAPLGVVSRLVHGLPDEDGASGWAASATRGGGSRRPLVAIVRYPTASNLDEFKLLEQVADVRWARAPEQLAGAELVILPGSKHTTADLQWLRQSGLFEAVRARAARGERVLGICGGLQMLGTRLLAEGDPVEQDADGLGLLAIETRFAADKVARREQVTLRGSLAAPWAALSGLSYTAYEIRQGRTGLLDDTAQRAAVDGAETTQPVFADGVPGFRRGPVLGIATHGLLESAPALAAILDGTPPARSLEQALDALRDAVVAGLDIEAIEALAQIDC